MSAAPCFFANDGISCGMPCVMMLEMFGQHGLVDELSNTFEQYEIWAAEMLDSHLAYPILPFFRSSHDAAPPHGRPRSHRSRICDWKGDHYSKERTRPGLLVVAGRQTRGPGLDEAEVRAVLMQRLSYTA